MRMGLLHKLIEFGVPKKDLILIYTLFIRSICEQSAVVWHSSLTQENRNNLERVQKTALKIILRNEYKTYESALVEVNLKNLDTRRETLCLNFAKSCLKNIQTKNMFPSNPQHSCVKDRLPTHAKYFHEKYQVNFANTDRLRKSPVIYMQHLLNQDHRCKE